MNSLEEQFFKTFGIEPQITDHILLKLICILSKEPICIVLANDVEELRKYILESCIKYSYRLDIQQVQELFKQQEETK